MAKQYIPPVGFYFALSFKGEQTGFKEVLGISLEMETEEIVAGGENRFLHRVPTIASFQNLVLKRGITSENSELLKWCENILQGSLSNPITPQNISVYLLDASGDYLMIWNFYNAYPIKFSVDALSGENNEVLIETLELVYTFFETTNNSKNSNH